MTVGCPLSAARSMQVVNQAVSCHDRDPLQSLLVAPAVEEVWSGPGPRGFRT